MREWPDPALTLTLGSKVSSTVPLQSWKPVFTFLASVNQAPGGQHPTLLTSTPATGRCRSRCSPAVLAQQSSTPAARGLDKPLHGDCPSSIHSTSPLTGEPWRGCRTGAFVTVPSPCTYNHTATTLLETQGPRPLCRVQGPPGLCSLLPGSSPRAASWTCRMHRKQARPEAAPLTGALPTRHMLASLVRGRMCYT